MSKFKRPNFYSEDSNIVSVWAAKVSADKIPATYFKENYEDDEAEFNEFSSDFGIGYYDHDFVESVGNYGGSNKEKLSFASFGKSFCSKASEACNVENVSLFFLMYDFTYEPNTTGVNESKYFRFIGCFEFDKNVYAYI